MKNHHSENKMLISEGITEDGIVVGNNFDKYASKNPLVKWMMNGFHSALEDLVNKAKPETIHELGCGEGYWAIEYALKGFVVRASDFSEQIVDVAKKNAKNVGLSAEMFSVRSIYDVTAAEDKADLIVCCEVLEHVDDPAKALAALRDLGAKDLIISVPREPIWRALNLARLKYVRDFGNTPGHIQHWSKSQFVTLINQYFEIKDVKSPFPWTMVHCKPYR